MFPGGQTEFAFSRRAVLPMAFVLKKKTPDRSLGIGGGSFYQGCEGYIRL